MRKFHLYLFKFHRMGLRYPRLTACVAAALVLIGLVGASNYRFLLSVDDLVDPDFKSYQALMDYKQNFPDFNSVIISIEPHKRPTKAFLCDVQRWAIRLNDKRSDLLRISSSFGVRQAYVNNRQLQFKPLFNLDCFSADPQTEVIDEAYQKLRASPWSSLLTDQNYALTLSISFEGHGAGNRFGDFNADSAEEIRQDFDRVLEPWKNEFEVFWAGVGSYQYELRKSFYISQVLNVIMFGFVLLFFKFFFKTWSLGWLFILTVDGALIITYGIMGFLDLPVDVLTNSTGMMLIVSTLEDFIFIVYGTVYMGMSWRKSMRYFLIPAFYTTITTAVGFASLAASDLSIIQRFGILSAVSGIIEWAFVFCVLPAILILVKSKWWIAPGFLSQQNSRLQKWLVQVSEIKFPKAVSLALLLIFPLAIWGAFKLNVEDSPEKFFAPGHIISEASNHLSKNRGWRSDVTLLFPEDATDESKNKILALARQWPNVSAVEDLPTTEKYLTSQVESEDHRQAIIQFWRESPFITRLKNESSERAILYLKSLERVDLEALVVAVEKSCPNKECALASGLTSYVEFGDRVLRTLFESLFISLALVLLIIFTLAKYKGSKNIFALCISSIWGPFALVVVFYVFQVPVFFITTICAAVLVGLSGDNSIQFIFNEKGNDINKSVSQLGVASLLVMIAMVFVTVIFFFSPMWPLQKLGGLMILGFWLGWIGDVIILRGLTK